MKVVFKPTTISKVLKPITRTISIDPLKEYPLLGIRLDGGGVFLRESKLGSQIAASALFQVKSGDFIYSRLFAWRGAFGIISDDLDGYYVSSEFPTFIPIQEKIESRFLQYWFRLPTTLSKVEADCTGSTPLTRNRFKENFFLALEIPLPSLEDQQRIVARIEELAAKIEEAKGLRGISISNTSHLLETAMRGFFNFEGATSSVGNFVSVLGGFAFPSEQYTEHGSHQIVRIGNIRDGYLDLSRAPVRWDMKNDRRIAKYELTEGDILISMTGTRNKRDYGYIATVPKGRKLLLNQRVGKFIFHAAINRRYLAYFLRSPFFRDHLFPNATGTANQANIGNKHIENVPFDPPTSLEEQKSIVAYLNDLQIKVNSLKQLQSETSAELDALLPSILDKAFKGEL